MFRKQPKIASIEQDIAAMSKETGTAVFSYDEIHHSKVDNELHYDYQKVIDGVSKAQNITANEAEERLLERGVLRPMPNGEYVVNVGGATRDGGGTNYGGLAFFTFSKEDAHSQYHEMAHSYQKQENLFDEDKLDKMYAISEKGLDERDNKSDKLADRNTYKSYLREVHADVFAQTALMLREKSTFGFAKQALYAQSHGESRNAEGVLAGVLDEGLGEKAKLYACKPVIHAAIKEVAAIRKAGQRADYFNPDGTLNAEKVSGLCERLVLDNAYSPRTYKAFVDYNFNDTHVSEEKDWKKGSLLAVAKFLPASGFMALNNGGKIIRKKMSKIRHNILRRKEISLLKKMSKQPQKSDNPKIQAANDYTCIQAKMQLAAANSAYRNADVMVAGMVDYMHKNEISSADLQEMSDALRMRGNQKILTEINKIVQQNKGNPHFQKIMDVPAKFTEMHEKTSDMSAKEKSVFFHNLRMGNNISLGESGKGLTAAQSMSKTLAQTNSPQQLNLVRMRMAKGGRGGE